MLIANPSLTKRYRPIAEVSRTGRAAVFRLEDRESGRDLALKVLEVPTERHQERLEWFHLRTEQLKEARDPTLPEILDFGQFEDGSLFLITEWVSAAPLSSFAHQSPAIAIFYAIQLADCLSRLALQNAVLISLSPENVVVQEDGRIRILGLGTPYCNPESVRRRRSGQLNACAAPEVGHLAALKSPDLWRADLFSFGALTAHELGCAVRGAAGMTPSVILPRPLGALHAAPVLQDVLQECLNAEPERRPPDYSLLVQLLERTLAALAPRFDPTAQASDDTSTDIGTRSASDAPGQAGLSDDGQESLTALREMWADGLSDVDLRTASQRRPTPTIIQRPTFRPPAKISDTQPLEPIALTEPILQPPESTEISAAPSPAAVHKLLSDPIFQHKQPPVADVDVQFEAPPELPTAAPAIHYVEEMGETSPTSGSPADRQVQADPSGTQPDSAHGLDWRYALAAAAMLLIALFLLRWWFGSADPPTEPEPGDDTVLIADAATEPAGQQARTSGDATVRLPASVARDLGLDPLDTGELPPSASVEVATGGEPPTGERSDGAPAPAAAADAPTAEPSPAAEPPTATTDDPSGTAAPETPVDDAPDAPDATQGDRDAASRQESETTPGPAAAPSRRPRSRDTLRSDVDRALATGSLDAARRFRSSLNQQERRDMRSSAEGRRKLSFLDLAVTSADAVEADLAASRPISATERANRLVAAFPQFSEVAVIADRSLQAARRHIEEHIEEGDASQALADLERIGAGATTPNVLRQQRVAVEALLGRQDARNRLAAIERLQSLGQPHRALDLLGDLRTEEPQLASELEATLRQQLGDLDARAPALEVDPFRSHRWQPTEAAVVHLLASDDYEVVGVRFLLLTTAAETVSKVRELPVEVVGEGSYRVSIPAQLHGGLPVSFWAEVWDHSRNLSRLGSADDPIVLNGRTPDRR